VQIAVFDTHRHDRGSAGKTSSIFVTSRTRAVPEMWVALWVRLYGALGTPMFGMKVVR